MVQPCGPARPRERRQGRQQRLPAALQRLCAGRLHQAHQERGQRDALARRGHDLLGRQERVRALGPRRSGSAWRDRESPQRRRPGGAGRDGVPLLRVYADPGQGGADRGPACRYLRGDVPARHQPGERPAAPYPLRHLQRGPHARGRQVAGHAPVPGLQLGQGRRRRLPQCPGVQPARAPRRADGAIRSQQRIHPHPGHAGGPAGLLVEASEGDRGQGRRAGHSLARQCLAHGRRQQADAGGQVP